MIVSKFSVQFIDGKIEMKFGKVDDGDALPEGAEFISEYKAVFTPEDLAEKRCFYHEDCHYYQIECPKNDSQLT